MTHHCRHRWTLNDQDVTLDRYNFSDGQCNSGLVVLCSDLADVKKESPPEPNLDILTQPRWSGSQTHRFGMAASTVTVGIVLARRSDAATGIRVGRKRWIMSRCTVRLASTLQMWYEPRAWHHLELECIRRIQWPVSGKRCTILWSWSLDLSDFYDRNDQSTRLGSKVRLIDLFLVSQRPPTGIMAPSQRKKTWTHRPSAVMNASVKCWSQLAINSAVKTNDSNWID